MHKSTLSRFGAIILKLRRFNSMADVNDLPKLTGMQMTDKIVIVTGASSGIGAAAANLLSRLQAKVVLVGRNEAELKKVQVGVPGESLIVKADLTNDDDRSSIIEKTIAKFQSIDSLINAAGIIVKGAVENTPLSVYDQVMDINVRSLVALTQKALPHIIAAKGTIVNVSSINGPCSFPNVTYYCMSKSAVDQFTKCLALEMAPHQVRVNAVNPGVIRTNLHSRGGLDDEQLSQFLEHSKTTHALGRVGEPEEAARAIAFLASPASSFTTGNLLRVDGGRGIISPR